MESYPDKQTTSAILLQQFLTGLLPTILCQLLLKGKPRGGVVDARDIEFAFAFEPPQDEQQDINVVHNKALPTTTEAQKLQSILEQVTKHLETLETKLEASCKSNQRYNPQRLRPVRQQLTVLIECVGFVGR